MREQIGEIRLESDRRAGINTRRQCGLKSMFADALHELLPTPVQASVRWRTTKGTGICAA